MKKSLIKPILFFVVVFVAVSLACGPSGSSTEEPEVVASPQPVEVDTPVPAEPAEEAEPAEPAEEVAQPAAGAVNSLDGVRSATIKIGIQGKFSYPEGEAERFFGGSGFIIDPSGIAVTNNHVVTGAALVQVLLPGETQPRNAQVLGLSECSDLAVIDIDGEGFPYLEWYTGDISVGLEIYAAGYPLGASLEEYTLLQGIVSKEKAGGESNWASVDSVIEHTALTNPGNSGGPIVTKDGKVVAVHYAGDPDAEQHFAIARDEAKPIIEKLRNNEDVNSIGVNSEAWLFEDGSSGIWVYSVASGSPADKAGLKGGDYITEIEGIKMATDGSKASYCDILRTHQPTDTLSLKVYRSYTGEFLDGQLNGRALEVVGTVDGGDTGGGTDGFVAVFDDTGAIGVEVPASWSEVDGASWENVWTTSSSNINFVAASVVASADIDGYYSNFGVPGVSFAASEDWSKIGGYIQLLDGTRGWYDSCDIEERGDYEDTFYEGKYDIWDCSGANVVVLAARPISDPSAYLSLLQIQASGLDAASIERILNTFDVVGNLP